jgi:glutamine amidotransferase-like uncharacterized protein
MKDIYLYTGKGAYQAKDIENFLACFDIDYKRIHEKEFDELKSESILIIPGGQVSSYLPAWETKGVELIKNFVENGGVYIGICAGSYVAGKNFKGEQGLGFFDEELSHLVGQSIISVKDKVGHSWEVIYENGPDLSNIKNERIVLVDNNNQPYAIEISYGKGKVYLFSAHPEGSVFYGKIPQDFSGAKFFLQFLTQL